MFPMVIISIRWEGIEKGDGLDPCPLKMLGEKRDNGEKRIRSHQHAKNISVDYSTSAELAIIFQ